jgi:hypothetical protein
VNPIKTRTHRAARPRSYVLHEARSGRKEPSDQQDLDALAVRLLAPVRTADFMPGERSHGWSEGVKVHMRSVHRLDITIAPAKSHQGRYGTGVTIIKIDPNKAERLLPTLRRGAAMAPSPSVLFPRSKP